MLNNVFLYAASLFFIWRGAGLIVSSVDKVSRRLKLSKFAISFVVLGLLTSIPEFAVGLTSIAEGTPQIFIGNLLGGTAVMFLFIIPLLSVIGKNLSMKHTLGWRSLASCLLVCLVPSLFVADRTITIMEGVVMISLYLSLLFFIGRRHGLLDPSSERVFTIQAYSLKDILLLLSGVGIVFISSRIIVEQTLYFSGILDISPFYISLFVLSIGTNLPELSIAISSVASGKKEIAFGDYLGSASANTLLFGIFTLLSGGGILSGTGYLKTFLFLLVGLGTFYIFARTKNSLSRKEGIILLGIYVLFIIAELFIP